MTRRILSIKELQELRALYEASEEHVNVLADKYEITPGSLRTIASREGWKKSDGKRVVNGRVSIPSDKYEEIEKRWNRFDDLKDVARYVGLDSRTTRKLCEQAFGERDEKAYFNKRNETIVKLWNAGSTTLELASQFWLGEGSVKTILSDAKRAGAEVRKPTKAAPPAYSDTSPTRSPLHAPIGHNRPKRKPKSKELTLEQWEAALIRFEQGEAVSSWSGQDGLPTIKQWHGHIERYPLFAQRVRSAMVNRRLDREAQIDWDTAIRRFEAGERLKDFVGQSGMPDHNRWHKRITEDQTFRERALAARSGHNPLGGLAGRERWKNFQALLSQGVQTTKAAEAAGMTAAAVQMRRQRWKDFREEYDGIISATRDARRAQALAEYHERFQRREAKAYSLQEAIARLPVETAKCGSVIEAARALGIGKAALRYSIATNRSLSELYEVERLAKERKAAERKQNAQRNAELRVLAKERKERNSTPVGVQLSRGLNQNEIYRVLNSTLPRGMDQDVRDDVLSSMVLAVLDGSTTLEEVKNNWKSYRTAYYRDFNWNSHVSLDEHLGDDGDGATRGDFIRSDQDHF